ncbi:MAG: hypothetical protein GWN99_00355 [Gemmatimonadetes bacterium]|uniref:UvrD-like helicase C-terminal domain-containing protein n=1 Tax=Candidatus Kutchimonas denitrificans TaxID=3056748 RepID=A0AAE5CBY6_9BACT|nr:hypothetical protein [Gemmatimonadota bacterium]NIR73559.1 hypothetical protein [Candidatus Kutchimonas denitrificans]NIR99518.1 hypothetical protein [Gemmatimonadota bacterium]NIT65138.1 hypothetical protein [Gemmatimonadota bacterium]NIV23671.1 hypothetical protein [Gemmatimonadota bacterium]
MTLHLVRASTSPRLWDELVRRFLDELNGAAGPEGYPSYLWLTHRVQREALYRAAAEVGSRGWLAPPVAFLSDLPELFGLESRPIGLMRRRSLIGGLGAARAAEYGLDGADDPDRGGIVQALDSLFGELLPEDVAPDELRATAEEVVSDDWSGRRNGWVVATYRDYLRQLDELGYYDPRQVHALVADRVMAGGLGVALRGASRLHVYGLVSRRTRGQLLEALAAQTDVEVVLYLLPELDTQQPEFEGDEEHIGGDSLAVPVVQPAPDGQRELEWVAGRIKTLLVEDAVDPRRIAIVVRTGREDSGHALRVLRAAGIPTTARLRSRLSEVPALKAVLSYFRGAARNWSYPALRAVLESAYFKLGIDRVPIDHLACVQATEGLDDWLFSLCDLQAEVERQEERAEKEDSGWVPLHADGIFADRMRDVCERFEAFRNVARPLDLRRPTAAWIEETRRLLSGDLFDYREELCAADGLDHEIVRLDQQGVEALTRMLGDWPDADAADELGPKDWYARLRRFLESNEIGVSTPLRSGVQVLEAHEAATFPFEHTFLIHANDGAFPRRWAPGSIFSDEERTRLVELGLPLSDPDRALARERRLWQAVTAGPHTVITYRTADSRGTPLLPSLLVPRHDETEEIPRTRFVPDPPLAPGQVRQRAAKALAKAKREGKQPAIEVVDPLTLKQGILNAAVETRRRPGPGVEAETLHPWTGAIRDPEVLARLERWFDSDYAWSASALERYASSPFLFLVGRVLRLSVRQEAEEETTRLTYGGVAHDVLQAFYETVLDDLPPSLDDRAKQVFEETFERVCKKRLERQGAQREWVGLAALWAITRETLREELLDYLRIELEQMAETGERPFRCELSFGSDEVLAIRGRDVAGMERTISVRGRIDRVDLELDDDTAVCSILDYKSGNVPGTKGYADGVAVQTPLYMKALSEMAVMQEARERVGAAGADVRRGRYRTLKKNGRARDKSVVEWGSEDFERALAIALTIPERVRAGRFELKRAKSAGDWAWWEPGLEVRRSNAGYEKGGRFDVGA